MSIIITPETRYKRLAAGQHGPGQLTAARAAQQPEGTRPLSLQCNVLPPVTSHCHSYTKLAFRTRASFGAKIAINILQNKTSIFAKIQKYFNLHFWKNIHMSQLFDFFSLSYLMETRALWMLSAVSVQCTGSGGSEGWGDIPGTQILRVRGEILSI